LSTHLKIHTARLQDRFRNRRGESMAMLGHHRISHKKNEKTEVSSMKKSHMSEHLKKKQMSKKSAPPTSLKPTE